VSGTAGTVERAVRGRLEAVARVPISAVVLTYNEEDNLPACLESLSAWVGEIFIVDSGSTDATLAIAERHGAKVVHHAFESHTRQWRWALESLPCAYEWVLGLDADQRVTPELRAELERLFAEGPAGPEGVDGIYVRRRQIFRGSWIRHGGYYPKYLLKLFRRGGVRIDENDLLDHHFYVAGPTRNLPFDILEDNLKEYDISFWIEKHNRYARLHAREEMARRHGEGAWVIEPALGGSPDQRIVWLKERWYRMPLYVRPALYFVYRYFLRLGFLDGKQGFIFHFLHAFWYRLLVDIHLDTLQSERARAARPDPEKR